MESFMMAVNVVVPLIVYMSVGALIRRKGILAEEDFRKVNTMIFRFLIPLTLFFNVYNADLNTAFQPKLYLFTAVMILAMFFSALFIAFHVASVRPDISALAQGIYRSNYVLLGTTIGISICGEAGGAMSAALSVLAIPMFNTLAVILFESMRGGKVKLGELILHIFQNPLVDAGLLGGFAGLCRIPIPEIIQMPLETLGDVATPMALVVLGGLLSVKSIVSHKKYLIVAVLCRLVFFPLVICTAAIAFGFRGVELVTLFSIAASPTAVSSVPMAQSMGGNGDLAGEIVMTTSVASILTIFIFVLGLSGLGFI